MSEYIKAAQERAHQEQKWTWLMQERVMPRTVIGQECWFWIGATSHGYGNLCVSIDGKKTWLRTHLITFLGSGKELSAEKPFVLHTCDVRSCVNPDHLFAGSQKDNIADMVKKGRHASQLKTHCPQGHPYDEANTYQPPGRPRRCLICTRAYQQKANSRRHRDH